MNKKYIKRQLTLHDLGIPMDRYISDIINSYKEFIEETYMLEKVNSDMSEFSFWKLGEEILLDYDERNKQLCVDDNSLWWIKYKSVNKKKRKEKVSYEDEFVIFESLLEHILKIDVINTIIPIISPNNFYESTF